MINLLIGKISLLQILCRPCAAATISTVAPATRYVTWPTGSAKTGRQYFRCWRRSPLCPMTVSRPTQREAGCIEINNLIASRPLSYVSRRDVVVSRRDDVLQDGGRLVRLLSDARRECTELTRSNGSTLSPWQSNYACPLARFHQLHNSILFNKYLRLFINASFWHISETSLCLSRPSVAQITSTVVLKEPSVTSPTAHVYPPVERLP